jgi:hypothetical protein
MVDMAMFEPGNQQAICLPANVINQQVHDMLLRDLADNPQDRHFRMAGILSALLWTKFPCPYSRHCWR